LPKRPVLPLQNASDLLPVKPYINWAPCIAEMDSLITGEPLII